MNLDSGFQMIAANLYPPCPQPELAMGIPPHSDHGLLNLLMQNGVSGLQLLHNGKWINVSSTSSCLLVFVSDHLEVHNNKSWLKLLGTYGYPNMIYKYELCVIHFYHLLSSNMLLRETYFLYLAYAYDI